MDGFPTPVEAWLRDERLRLVDRFVLGASRSPREVFDLDRVRRFWRQRLTVGSSWGEVMWRIVSLSVWGEQFGVRV